MSAQHDLMRRNVRHRLQRCWERGARFLCSSSNLYSSAWERHAIEYALVAERICYCQRLGRNFVTAFTATQVAGFLGRRGAHILALPSAGCGNIKASQQARWARNAQIEVLFVQAVKAVEHNPQSDCQSCHPEVPLMPPLVGQQLCLLTGAQIHRPSLLVSHVVL